MHGLISNDSLDSGLLDGVGSAIPFAQGYSSFDKFDTVQPAAVGTFVTVMNITGKGYLLEAYAYSSAEIKITVDGAVINWTTGTSGWTCGILNIDSQPGANGSGKMTGNNMQPGLGGGMAIPTSARTTDQTAMIGCPVFFNQSLRVEVTELAASQTVGYGVRGGYK